MLHQILIGHYQTWGLTQREMKWANTAVQSRQMDFMNIQMNMGRINTQGSSEQKLPVELD